MGSEAQNISELISELKTCFSSIDFQNTANLLIDRQQNLLNKTHFLENENNKLNTKIQILENENDGLKAELKNKQNEVEVFEKDEILKLNALLKKKDLKIQTLENENDGLKNEVIKMQNDLGVRVLNLENLSKDLMGSESFSEVKKAKKLVDESSRPPPPPPPGFEEILDSKPKKEKESKHQVIIEIDDDDDDRDLMKLSSSKRSVSDATERDDNDADDDNKCISVLKRKKVTEEIAKNHKNANSDDKVPMRTQPTTDWKSPFCDSSGSDSDDEKANFSAKMDLPKDRWATEGDMVIEFAKDYQLCWNAICALHKQDVSQKHVVLLRPSDASRISSMSRKKTITDLSPFDRHQCRQFAMDYSAQIFDIYREN